MQQLTQAEVMAQYPEAFAALPEPYQNDSCLEFWTDQGDLFAAPEPGQESALGDWVSMFLDPIWVTCS